MKYQTYLDLVEALRPNVIIKDIPITEAEWDSYSVSEQKNIVDVAQVLVNIQNGKAL